MHSKSFMIGPAIALAGLSLAPSAAIAQQASELQSESQAELAEARAIIDIMLPPATRQKMLDDLTMSSTDADSARHVGSIHRGCRSEGHSCRVLRQERRGAKAPAAEAHASDVRGHGHRLFE